MDFFSYLLDYDNKSSYKNKDIANDYEFVGSEHGRDVYADIALF